MDETLKNQILTQKLVIIKNLIKSGCYLFINRSINTNTLAKYGISINCMEQLIMRLTPENYYKGPETDRDGSEGEIWIFNHPINNTQLYIKLKLIAKKSFLKIISFHD